MSDQQIIKKIACYDVVNGNGGLIKPFGVDYKSAKHYAKTNKGNGLMYGLRVRKYFSKEKTNE